MLEAAAKELDIDERAAILLAAVLRQEGGSSLNPRQEKVLQYIIHRMGEDAALQAVLKEEYVRRNCSQAELERIISSPGFIEAARQQLGESFRSDDLRL